MEKVEVYLFIMLYIEEWCCEEKSWVQIWQYVDSIDGQFGIL